MATASFAGERQSTTGTESPDVDSMQSRDESLPLEKRPICVDLDGTLVQTDTLVEGLLRVVSTWEGICALPSLLTFDRALLKQRVANAVDFEPELLPYNQDLIEFLRTSRAQGHQIVLVTAADARIAHAVAEHLNLFDDVISSDGQSNLKGRAKAQALIERFGEKGFDYIGDDRSDLPVWEAASRVMTVNADSSTKRVLGRRGRIDRSFDTRNSLLKAAIRAMRPHQWSKNVLVFVPMLTALDVNNAATWLAAFFMLFSFCATASSIYIVNDLLDLPSDRRHPRKSKRPIPSGQLPIVPAVALAGVLATVGLALSSYVGALYLVLIYAAISVSYSLALKTFPLVDIFILAALYTIRLIGGGIATEHPVSLWLFGFSGFIFLSLALVKRTGELKATAPTIGNQLVSRRGYYTEDLPILQMFGCAAAFSSSVVLALFVGSSRAFEQYQTPEALWLIVPMVLFWQCRLWLATSRGYMHDDPIVYASKDWVSWFVAAGVLAAMFAAASGIILLA